MDLVDAVKGLNLGPKVQEDLKKVTKARDTLLQKELVTENRKIKAANACLAAKVLEAQDGSKVVGLAANAMAKVAMIQSSQLYKGLLGSTEAQRELSEKFTDRKLIDISYHFLKLMEGASKELQDDVLVAKPMCDLLQESMDQLREYQIQMEVYLGPTDFAPEGLPTVSEATRDQICWLETRIENVMSPCLYYWQYFELHRFRLLAKFGLPREDQSRDVDDLWGVWGRIARDRELRAVGFLLDQKTYIERVELSMIRFGNLPAMIMEQISAVMSQTGAFDAMLNCLTELRAAPASGWYIPMTQRDAKENSWPLDGSLPTPDVLLSLCWSSGENSRRMTSSVPQFPKGIGLEGTSVYRVYIEARRVEKEFTLGRSLCLPRPGGLLPCHMLLFRLTLGYWSSTVSRRGLFMIHLIPRSLSKR